MIEAKVADGHFSKDLLTFQIPDFREIERIQLVKECLRPRSTGDGAKLVDASEWLSRVEIEGLT